MMWGGGALRWWGHESKDFMNGLILLWKRPPRSPSALPPCEDTVKTRPHQEQSFTRTWPSLHLHLRCLASRFVGNAYLLLKPPAFCLLWQPKQTKTVLPFASASLAEHHVFKVHPHCSLCQSFTPSFHGWVIFHCVDGLHCVYQFSDRLLMVSVVSSSFRVGNCTAVNMCAQVFGFTHKSGIAGSCANSKFDILRICQNVFQMAVPFLIPTGAVWRFKLP